MQETLTWQDKARELLYASGLTEEEENQLRTGALTIEQIILHLTKYQDPLAVLTTILTEHEHLSFFALRDKISELLTGITPKPTNIIRLHQTRHLPYSSNPGVM